MARARARARASSNQQGRPTASFLPVGRRDGNVHGMGALVPGERGRGRGGGNEHGVFTHSSAGQDCRGSRRTGFCRKDHGTWKRVGGAQRSCPARPRIRVSPRGGKAPPARAPHPRPAPRQLTIITTDTSRVPAILPSSLSSLSSLSFQNTLVSDHLVTAGQGGQGVGVGLTVG